MTQRAGDVAEAPSSGTLPDMRALGLRVPDDLHAWLAAMAVRDRRSLNAEVIVLLERARELIEHERAYLPGSEPPPPR